MALEKLNLAYQEDIGKKNLCKYSFRRDMYMDSPYIGIIRCIQKTIKDDPGGHVLFCHAASPLNICIKFQITANVSGKLEYLKIICYEYFGPSCLTVFFLFER